ncbi:hypothetical protein KBP51_12105 [Lactiplantibacillus pentosus]|uniref:hypothetical protein n=1 Tax=Lactiplantibacillus pentosus TaxID=1589 RepID=UPI00132FE77F|nr:hypothetical protein [Lactiplantibacillus pentosus]MBQ0837170.1 hypothetical protein [Lactiplantibacillus pentosus]
MRTVSDGVFGYHADLYVVDLQGYDQFDHMTLNFACHWTCILMGSLLDYIKCSATLYLVYRAPPTIYSV